MEKKLVTEAERFLNSRHHDRRRTRVIRGLALLVVVATVSALIMPAVTMSNETECGLEEHIHTESCYAIQQVAPQPVLACTVGESGAIVIHTHDEYCYDSLGNLICNLPEVEAHVHGPECYQEHRTLICDQVADPGHQHSAACYSYVRVENVDVVETAPVTATEYICGLQEGEGAHRHTEECYPEERVAEPLCGLEETGDVYDDAGNLIQQGHTHTRECWYERVHEKLVCGLEESEDEYDEEGNLIRAGHHHDSSCWLTGDALCYQYGCGQHESAGHVHTDSCTVQVELQPEVQVDAQGEEWVKNLICGEEERAPGHVHTDECYEITQVLTCRTQELQPHTHSAACYDETGALICGKQEVLVHQHTEACFVTPEGGPEPTKVLICGMEEHTHTDLCFVKTAPETEKYYCGMEEHIHNQDCYFESGALKCTIPEHVHADECLTPPLDEGVEVEEVSVEMDETFTHDTELFHMEISVTGTAVARTYSMELEEPEVPMARLPILSGFLSFLFGPFVETASAASIEEFDEPEGAPSELTVVENDSQESFEPVPAEPDWEGEPAEETVVFNVEEVFSGEDYDTLMNRMRELVDEDETIAPIQVMEITAFAGGQQLDLAGCQITVMVQPTRQLASALSEEGISTMGLDEDDFMAAESGELGEPSMSLMILPADGVLETRLFDSEELQNAEELPPVAVSFVVPRSGNALYATATNYVVNPTFTVQFYANLNVPENTTGSSNTTLPFINTSSAVNNGEPTMPQNGITADPPLISLGLNTDGTVVFNTKATEIYKSEEKEFNPKLGDDLNIDYLNSLRDNGHYVVKELWVLKEIEGESEEARAERAASTDKSNWDTYKLETDEFAFTNKPELAGQTDDSGRTYIAINPDTEKPNTVIRLVYDPASEDDTFKATFYDYDISSGPKTTTNMVTQASGINSYFGNAANARFAFGNSNMGTDFGDDIWNGNLLNKGNNGILGDTVTKSGTAATYKGLTFGLVSGMKTNSDGSIDVNFSNGITPPSIGVFGNTSGTGKRVYGNWNLNFNRAGDTFTLSSVSMSDNKNVESGLEKFGHPGKYDGVQHPTMIWTNNFWPLDQKWLDEEKTNLDILDPMFGGQPLRYRSNKYGTGVAPSDDGQNHNSYFGMTYSVNFDLVEEYVGPLEYYFYGDDDMWVFLTNKSTNETKLVCDIGGVHSSVGEYVDLWDYIPGGRDGHAKGQYTLSIFYTERGASGSTCWMQFTLPQISQIYNEPYDPTAAGLTITKEIAGVTDGKESVEFPFELTLGNIYNNYTARICDASGENITATKTVKDSSGEQLQVVESTDGDGETIVGVQVSKGKYTFELKAGEHLEVIGLPGGTTYMVEEKYTEDASCITDVNTKVSGNGKSTGTTGQTVIAQGTLDGWTDSDENYYVDSISVTYTNTFGYELPETGGGTRAQWYTMACAPMALAAGCLWYKKRTHGEGAEDGA